jgi:hypothetical protein
MLYDSSPHRRSARPADGRSEHRVSAEHPSSGLRGGVFCTGGSGRTLSMVALPSSSTSGCVRSGDMRLDQPSPVALGAAARILLDAADQSPQWTPTAWTQIQSTGARQKTCERPPQSWCGGRSVYSQSSDPPIPPCLTTGTLRGPHERLVNASCPVGSPPTSMARAGGLCAALARAPDAIPQHLDVGSLLGQVDDRLRHAATVWAATDVDTPPGHGESRRGALASQLPAGPCDVFSSAGSPQSGRTRQPHQPGRRRAEVSHSDH